MVHEFQCCICGKHEKGWGNNHWPVKESGECCFDCNCSAVIPARIKLSETKNSENNESNDPTTETVAE